jgi:uncharacterized membrane protein YfcA
VVGRLSAGSVPTTSLTLLALAQLDLRSAAVGDLITWALGGALLVTGLALIFRKKILAAYAARIGRLNSRHTAVLTVVTGAVLGVLVSISSVGAGAIGMTALILLYPHLPTERIVGSDIAHAVPLTLLAGIGHWFLGSVDWQLVGILLAGSLPGIVLGSLLSTRVPDAVLRFVLAFTLILVGGKLVF